MGDNLKEKTISALKWSTVDRFGQQAVQFVVGIILANTILPEDFGLFGMLAIFNALSFVLVESGFGQALVRKKSSDPREFSSIFYFDIVTGIFLYILLYFSAPSIAGFFQQPELVSLSRFTFIVIIFNAFYLIQINILGIKLDYKNIAKVNFISTIVSGSVGVTLAVTGFGVWALAVQLVCYHLIRMISFFYFVRWKPLLFFSFDYIREHWKFSISLLGTGVLNVIFNNIFILVLGKYFPLKEVGYYNQANKQSETVNYAFVSVLTGTTYNVFSQIHEQTERLKHLLREFSHKTAVLVIPAGFFLLASAENLLVSLIGEVWLPAVPFFQLICAANLVSALYQLNINTLNARGKSRITFRTEIFKKTLILLSIVGLFSLGSKMMIAGYVIACWVAYLITMIEVKREINHYWTHQLKDILPAVGIGLLIGIAVWAISLLPLEDVVLLIMELGAAGILYLVCIRLFYKEMYTNILAYISKSFNTISKKN